MSTLVLTYLNTPAFLSLKDHVNTLVTVSKNDVKSSEKIAYNDIHTGCTCCGWRGKISQTEKNYLFLDAISEIESFCPECHTYLGFISDNE